MILDSKKEKEIGLGRDFPTELLGKGQAFVIESALRYLGLEANNQDQIQVRVDLRDYLTLFYDTNNPLTIEDVRTLASLFGGSSANTETIEISPNKFFNVTEIDSKFLTSKIVY